MSYLLSRTNFKTVEADKANRVFMLRPSEQTVNVIPKSLRNDFTAYGANRRSIEHDYSNDFDSQREVDARYESKLDRRLDGRRQKAGDYRDCSVSRCT
ncbi:hypothetical protein RRG08_003792 [Elysia crispata]|uniref:Uncharacterized protein n=1 Tax=Elysia crispata TaxID=231223 RepID=A0AAE1AVE4_9GAST|nr:hypothetical protein RRG08_003792 [Elysia crispata]